MSGEFLTELGRLLGDDVDAAATDRVFLGRGAGAAGEVYTVVPAIGKARLLVPHGDRRAAGAAIRHTSAPRSAKDRLRQRVLAGVFSTGLGSRTLGDLVFRDRLAVQAQPTLAEHLSGLLGQRVRLSVRFGPPRANRKPVLQLIDDRAHTVAYAKMAVNDLTTTLVDAEHRALSLLSGRDLAPARVPEVLHFGTWAGASLLVVGALPVSQDAPPDGLTPLSLAAMRSIAQVQGVTRSTYAGSSYAARLAAQVDALGERPTAGLMRRALAACADAELGFGCWHGDWNGGNMSVRGGELLLWDFERFTPDVPVGYDPLHFELHEAVAVRHTDPVTAARAVAGRAAELLAPLGVDAAVANEVAALYFVEIGSRYLGDGLDNLGRPMGRVDEWIIGAFAGLGGRWASLVGEN
ncbi:hypothetical protein [Catellatospora methionotrophica]|uniref:hypothetical protein n=1 Tax=Catellatospora methionotrophica TaxID=121620 RepID=UPI00340488D4